jgi:hypothetical protein
MNSRLVYNIDETGCSDWERRRSYEVIVAVELADGPVHFGVSRWIKHQTMLVCINVSAETLCPLIAATDRSASAVSRNGIEEGADLKVQIAGNAFTDATIFHDDLRDVLIPKIEKFREASVIPDEPTILLVDNCSAHTPLQ